MSEYEPVLPVDVSREVSGDALRLYPGEHLGPTHGVDVFRDDFFRFQRCLGG